MWNSKAVRYVVYTTSAVLFSEVLLYAYKKISKRWEKPQEIAEVIWTNELTQSCAGRHEVAHRNSTATATTPTPSSSSSGQESKSRVGKLAAPTATPLCRNRFCAANNVGRLIALIDETKYTIDLAMYTFTSYDLSHAFLRALRRGVDIRIISDKEMVYSSGSQIITLTKSGVPVRSPSSTMLMHHKFCILDGPMHARSVLARQNKKYNVQQVRGILMSGSLNWTMQGFGGNWENIIITSNEVLVRKFEEEYERLWKKFQIAGQL